MLNEYENAFHNVQKPCLILTFQQFKNSQPFWVSLSFPCRKVLSKKSFIPFNESLIYIFIRFGGILLEHKLYWLKNLCSLIITLRYEVCLKKRCFVFTNWSSVRGVHIEYFGENVLINCMVTAHTDTLIQSNIAISDFVNSKTSPMEGEGQWHGGIRLRGPKCMENQNIQHELFPFPFENPLHFDMNAEVS